MCNIITINVDCYENANVCFCDNILFCNLLVKTGSDNEIFSQTKHSLKYICV